MRNVRFLVVDDSALARSLIVSVIRKRLGGERILQASSGKEAILLLQEQAVDLIISDWNMEQIDGAELLEYVRGHQRLRHIPFIMVTTNNRQEFIVNAFRLGVSQYLVKPFTPAELEQRIRAARHTASRRATERHFELPPHRVLFKSEGRLGGGQLLDISRSGALMRVRSVDLPALQQRCELSLSFSDPDSRRQWLIPTLIATAVRLEAESEGYSLVALRFEADELAPEAAAAFNALIEWLDGRTPQLINN